ncbi:MAG: tyrosyl-tRNA synthetase [Pelagibacterales bacterium]|nr:tyrosyl-tRNA synthetase [Pelagibacterales bacterium]|tara:strand:- start:9719 stop:10960 length:1242 start_codon:yes stop_codon:yes gene_type:complete
MKNNFINEITQRGFFHQCTDQGKLTNLINSKPIKAYIGFDCTAPSLHVGSLLQIMCLRLLQKYGHQPIVLLGGGTTLIGDPSGKDATRKILDEKTIDINIKKIKKIFEKLLDFKNEKTKPLFVNNAEWLNKLQYIEFLRNIGKHFTINKMLSFDSVKLRLEREQSLSYMEFNYMILQAYDFYKLNEKYDCSLQLGGSDQWGNIINGVELIRKVNHKESFGLTTPLITVASGAKMGKTENGAIWLDEELLSPYEYWQFWRNTNDKDVKSFLKYFTEINISELDELSNKKNNINNLKILLANEATKILHGTQKANESEKTAKETFDGGGIGKNLPETILEKSQIKNGISIVELIHGNKIMNSKSKIRRAINENSIKINDELVRDEKKIIVLKDFEKNNCVKVSHGKKKHYIIKLK